MTDNEFIKQRLDLIAQRKCQICEQSIYVPNPNCPHNAERALARRVEDERLAQAYPGVSAEPTQTKESK